MGATLMLVRNTTAARPLLLLLLLLPRHTTAARPVSLLLLLPRHDTAARPVLLLLLLLLLLPRHYTAAKYHTVVSSLVSASPDPPVPRTTADDKRMRVQGIRRRTRRRPWFFNFVGLALGVGGTDGVFWSRESKLRISQSHSFYIIVAFRKLAENDLNNF